MKGTAMFGKLNLRQRILLGYLAPLLLLAGAMAMVFVNLQKASRALEQVDAGYHVMDMAKDLAGSLIKMQRAARGQLLIANTGSRDSYQENERRVDELAGKLSGQVTDTEQRDNLRGLLQVAKELNGMTKEFIVLAEAGRSKEAQARFRGGASFEKSRELDARLDRFIQREAEILAQRKAAYEAAMSALIGSILYGGLGAIVLALVIGYWLAAALSRDITANASQLAAATSEIAATVTQHERTASEQAAAANETSATITELSASARQSAEQAASAAAAAEKAGETTSQGGEVARQAVDTMTGLKDRIGAMAEQIVRLGEQSGQIGGIATLVKDLAAQINMLALNAAVEAARAGEHGKGFAVVASEVRKLAGESRKSAEQAGLLVADIQKAANASVLITEEGSRAVAEVTQLAGRVGSLFDNLSAMAEGINENAQQVMLNARQQAAAFGQVVEATNSIAAGARETAAGIGQTRVGVQQLNQAAENLKAIA